MGERRYKFGISREQSELFPARLDDYVGPDNTVRAIDAYVESLDLARSGFRHTEERVSVGQPAYAPGSLLKLYLYGYLNRVRSSRQLGRECERNVEVMWLVQGLRPTYRTIASFRRHNAGALRGVHQEFVSLSRELGLLSGTRVAVDGSHFKGNVSAKSFVTRKGLKKGLARDRRDIERWLQELESEDAREEREELKGSVESLEEKIAALRARVQVRQAALEELEAAGEEQHSRTDADARMLNKRGQKVQGYNVQIAVDDQHHLIVADEVTREMNDQGQLVAMAEQAKQALGVERVEVLADEGYYSAAQLKACEEGQVTAYVPEPRKGKRSRREEGYEREAFVYDAQRDAYRCPAGQWLTPQGQWREVNGQHIRRYVSRQVDCGRCAQRAKCLTAKAAVRELWRSEHAELLQAHRERMAANTQVLGRRKELAEHPFGTIKQRSGWTHFLVRGLDKVRGEWSLMAMAYNFTRVLNLLGVETFVEVCRRRAELRVSA